MGRKKHTIKTGEGKGINKLAKKINNNNNYGKINIIYIYIIFIY